MALAGWMGFEKRRVRFAGRRKKKVFNVRSEEKQENKTKWNEKFSMEVSKFSTNKLDKITSRCLLTVGKIKWKWSWSRLRRGMQWGGRVSALHSGLICDFVSTRIPLVRYLNQPDSIAVKSWRQFFRTFQLSDSWIRSGSSTAGNSPDMNNFFYSVEWMKNELMRTIDSWLLPRSSQQIDFVFDCFYFISLKTFLSLINFSRNFFLTFLPFRAEQQWSVVTRRAMQTTLSVTNRWSCAACLLLTMLIKSSGRSWRFFSCIISWKTYSTRGGKERTETLTKNGSKDEQSVWSEKNLFTQLEATDGESTDGWRKRAQSVFLLMGLHKQKIGRKKKMFFAQAEI